jgi:hypothetical protein
MGKFEIPIMVHFLDITQSFFFCLSALQASEKKIGLQTMDDDRHQLIAIADMTFTVK